MKHLAPKILTIAGVAYIAYRAMASGEAAAAVVDPETGAAVVIRRADNRPAGAMSAADIAAVCADANAQNGTPFDIGDLMAICFVESSWRPSAYRYEAALNDASMGLFQTLYSTARDMGYSGPPEGLYDPATSAFYGVKYLAWCRDYMARALGGAPGWLEILSCYNGGPGRAAKGWRAHDYYSKFLQARAGIAP